MLIFGLLYGLILVGGGINSILAAFKKRKKVAMGIHHEFISIIAILCGCTGIAGYFLHSEFGIWTCLFFLTGVLCIWAPFYERKLIKTCTTPIEAKCIKYNKRHTGHGQTSHAPVFEYNYLDGLYTTQTPVGYLSEKKLQKKYMIGTIYQVWIDEKNPHHCIERKGMPFYKYFMVLPGVMCLIVYWYVLQPMF